MGKHGGGTRISRPISANTVGGNSAVGNGGKSARFNRKEWYANTPAEIRAAEAQVMGNTYETAFVFDAQGNLLFSKRGTEQSVNVSGIKAGDIVAHNHPRGTSLSGQDIETAATKNLKEIRAIGRNGRIYSLKSGGKDWGNINKLASAYRTAEQTVRTKLKAYVSRGESIGEADYERRVITANRIHQHLVVKYTAREMGYEYITTTVKNN